MIKKLSISMALLASAFLVQAQNQHDFVGFGNISTPTITSSDSGLSLGVNAEKSLQNGMFVGAGAGAGISSVPFGSGIKTNLTFGKAIPLQNNIRIEATVTYGATILSHPLVALQASPSSTTYSGFNAGVTIVMPLAYNQLNFDVSKGISGNYWDSNMVLSAAIRTNLPPDLFVELGYGSNSGGNIFSFIIGKYF